MKSVMKLRMFRAAVVSLCGAGLVVSAAVAQQDAPAPPPDGQQQGMAPGMGMGGARGPERRLQMMQKQLNLTEDQTTKVKAIFAEAQTKMEALHANSTMSQSDRRAQGKALHEDVDAKIHAVLTPEQTTKLDAMETRMREHRHEGMEGGAPPPPPPPPPPPAPQK